MTRVLNEFEEKKNIFASKINENFTNLQLDIGDVSSSVTSISSTVTGLQNSVSNLTIVGNIIWIAQEEELDGFLVCNGAAISRTEYSALFAKIGTTYGEGDGSTTFNLPNLIGKGVYGSTTLNESSLKTGIEDTAHGHTLYNAMGGNTTKHTDVQNADHKHTIPAIGLLPFIKY